MRHRLNYSTVGGDPPWPLPIRVVAMSASTIAAFAAGLFASEYVIWITSGQTVSSGDRIAVVFWSGLCYATTVVPVWLTIAYCTTLVARAGGWRDGTRWAVLSAVLLGTAVVPGGLILLPFGGRLRDAVSPEGLMFLTEFAAAAVVFAGVWQWLFGGRRYDRAEG